MSEVVIAEYAERYGLSEQVVRRAAREGTVPARKVGGVWLIDDGVRLRPQRRRSLSERTAAALLAQIDGGTDAVPALQATERRRISERVVALCRSESASDLFVAWFRPRVAQPLVRRFVQPSDLADLRADERVIVGGVSDPRAEISAPDFLEAHVADADLADLEREFLMRESGSPNVALHVDAVRPPDPIPLSTLLLDLASDGGPRERRRLTELLRSVSR